MKKIVALLLVVLMLGSTAAFAVTDGVDENARIDQYVDKNYKNDGKTTSLDTPKTELWLQVDATGQIDVTVPLVLVFKTNIDGGTADTASNYMITSASSADLVVTDIKVNVNPEDKDGVLAADSNPMELVAYSAATADDTYGVMMTVDEQTDSFNASRPKFEKDIRKDILGAGLNENTIHADAKEGGWFLLKKDASTIIDVDMTTGDLSFVTKRMDSDDAQMDTAYGVKLLTITYTVGIDTKDALGTDIGAGAGLDTGAVNTSSNPFPAP